MQNRDISSLEDNFEKRLRLAMDEYNLTARLKIFVVEGLRTIAQQQEYVRKGASKTMKSNHLTGKAVDIAFNGPELYPTNNITWDGLLDVMHKYGIVNGYYDLKRGFDKPHFQPVEIQQPSSVSLSYNYTLSRKDRIKQEINKNSDMRNTTNSQALKDQLHMRNKKLREIL